MFNPAFAKTSLSPPDVGDDAFIFAPSRALDLADDAEPLAPVLAAAGPPMPGPGAQWLHATTPGDAFLPEDVSALAVKIRIGDAGDNTVHAPTGVNLVATLGGNDTIHIDSHDAGSTGIFAGGDGDDSFFVEITGATVAVPAANLLLIGGYGRDSFDIYFEIPENSRTEGALPAAPLILDYEAGEQITLHSHFVYYYDAAYVSSYELDYNAEHDITYVVGIPDSDYYGPPSNPYTPEPAVVLGIAGAWDDDNGLNIDFYTTLDL